MLIIRFMLETMKGLPSYYRDHKVLFILSMGFLMLGAIYNLVYSVRAFRSVSNPLLRFLLTLLQGMGSIAILFGGLAFNRAQDIAELTPEMVNRRFFLEITIAAVLNILLYWYAMTRNEKNRTKLQEAGLWSQDMEQGDDTLEAEEKAILRNAAVAVLSVIGIFTGTAIIHFGPNLFGRSIGAWLFSLYAGLAIGSVILFVASVVEMPLIWLFGNSMGRVVEGIDESIDHAIDKGLETADAVFGRNRHREGHKKDGSGDSRSGREIPKKPAIYIAAVVVVLVVLSFGVIRHRSTGKDQTTSHDSISEQTDYYSLPLKELRKMAQAGDIDAQYEMGNRFYLGYNGAKQNNKKAMKWYRKAAKQGDPRAQRNLGQMYLSGEAGETNYEKAWKWFHLSADQNYGLAMRDIGFMIQMGYGPEKGLDKARKWYQKAVENGYPYAYYDLGYSYLDNEEDRDASAAADYFEKGAEAGYSECAISLAELYMEGDGIKRNDRKAFKVLKEASENGEENGKVYYLLGELYETGRGTDVNIDKAIECYTKAVKNGYEPAATSLDRLKK